MRVMVVDDHVLVRDGIASLLRAEGFEVVGEATSGAEALERARELRPNLILMDITMPGVSGLEATHLLKAEMPEVSIVMLTVSDAEEDLIEAIKSGAVGYLLKDVHPDRLFESLRAVGRGEAVIPGRLASRILVEFRTLSASGEAERPEETPTPRERDVLALVAEGLTNKEVAGSLSLSQNTVKSHMRRILQKLHLHNRAQVAAWAAQRGMVAQ